MSSQREQSPADTARHSQGYNDDYTHLKFITGLLFTQHTTALFSACLEKIGARTLVVRPI